MKILLVASAAAVSLAGCNQQKAEEKPAEMPAIAEQAPKAEIYSGTGKITAIAGDEVSIAHGPIAGIGWPAMTMTFTRPSGMAANVAVGSDVSFAFRQDGSAYVLTNLEKR